VSMRKFLAAMAAMLALSSRAADTDPLEVPVRQYGFVLFIALLGGIVSFYGKVRAGQVQAFSLLQLIGEMATSAFAGLLAFWVCTYAGTPPLITAALVGIAGHMGTRAIALFEEWAQRKAKGP
jgi:hypothetical protein